MVLSLCATIIIVILDFKLNSSLKYGILSLFTALNKNYLDDPMNNPKYYNIKTMQQIKYRL